MRDATQSYEPFGVNVSLNLRAIAGAEPFDLRLARPWAIKRAFDRVDRVPFGDARVHQGPGGGDGSAAPAPGAHAVALARLGAHARQRQLSVAAVGSG